MRQRPMPRRSTGSRRPTPVPAANPARGGRGGPRGVTPPKVAPQMQRGGRGGSAMPAGRATPQIQQKAQQEAQFNQMAQAGIKKGSRQQATQTSGRMGTPAPQGGQQARPMPQMQRRKSGGAVKKK
jgi:hypothetical protein